MICGTVAVQGDGRAACSFEMDLFDTRPGRTLHHQYGIEVLPEFA
jgi:hypothetical protein